MVVKPFTVDFDKPLVFQLLTRTTWWVIPIVWLPVVSWSVFMSFRTGLTLPQVALSVVGGIFIWTLTEYVMHRFLFHMKTTSYWGNTIHYLLHGCHHKHPMDGMRLAFPPAATAIFCVPFWIMFRLLSPPLVAPALFGGTLLGYVAYDVIHYYLHHGKPSNRLTQDLMKSHLNHHFRVQSKGFGLTSTLWDNVFGTVPSTKDAEKMSNQ